MDEGYAKLVPSKIKLDWAEVNEMPGRARVLKALNMHLVENYQFMDLVTNRGNLANDLSDLVILVDVKKIHPLALVKLVLELHPDSFFADLASADNQSVYLIHLWWD